MGWFDSVKNPKIKNPKKQNDNIPAGLWKKCKGFSRKKKSLKLY